MTQFKIRSPESHLRVGLRILAAIFFVIGGANHFYSPVFYRNIVPPGFPSPAALVVISGIAEIVGGIGILIRPLRSIAGWGLIALLIAVFPANIYMAIAPEKIPDMHFAHWMLWARLPLQIIFVAWVWFASSRASSPQHRHRAARE